MSDTKNMSVGTRVEVTEAVEITFSNNQGELVHAWVPATSFGVVTNSLTLDAGYNGCLVTIDCWVELGIPSVVVMPVEHLRCVNDPSP